jgi:ABC-type transport system involved in multi-copper enzyme maturation permease subunit
MKFLAMLKDSLREAIDSKVFYVMVGLSTLLILLAMTATFSPKPGGEAFMRTAALPLSVNLAEIDSGGPDDEPAKLIERLRKNSQDVYRVTEVEPIDGGADLPTSTFLVKISVVPIPKILGGARAEGDPAERIREKFGRLGDWTVADVLDVKTVTHQSTGLAEMFLGKPSEFDVTVRPTQMALRLWPHDFSLFFGSLPVFGQEKGAMPLGMLVYFIEQLLINSIGAWITILLSIVITAFFVPNMLRKGTVDLLLVKPISRPVLLMYKYVGGLLFIALNTAIAVAGVWLAFGLRAGIWSPGFLASIPVITFFFAILYSASTFFAVLTRSPIVAILLTCGVWFLFFIVGSIHSIFEVIRELERADLPRSRVVLYAGSLTLPADATGAGALLAATTLVPPITDRLTETRPYDWKFARLVAAIHYVLPRTSDLSALNSQLSFREIVFPIALNAAAKRTDSISWGESLTVSFGFIAVMLGLSCWLFYVKDY